jgi:hypothetical protein
MTYEFTFQVMNGGIMLNDRSDAHSLYHGFYIGPFRDKTIHEDRESEAITKESREVNFDYIFAQLQTFVQEWGDKHSYPIIFEKAESQMLSALIDDNVKAHIDKCDFIIADISGDNRNALLELGYAEGRSKPYIIISQGTIQIQLPTDKHGRLIAPYDPKRIDILKHNLGIQLEYVMREIALQRSADNYPVECYSTRDIRMIDRLAQESSHCIHILQTNLETFNANHLGHIKARMAESPDLRLRLLTLDAQSSYVNERARQLGRSGDGIGIYRNGLVTSLDQARLELEPLKERVMIKVYDDFPTQMTYRFDERLLVCTVSRITKSRDNCSFLINQVTRKGIAQSFVDHFKALWKSTSTRTVFGNLSDDHFLEGTGLSVS